MQLNWITVGMLIIVALIAYTAYKVFKVWYSLKTPALVASEPSQAIQPKVPTKPAEAAPPKPIPISQPKLVPPAIFRKPVEESESEYDSEEVETEMFNLNEETEYNDTQQQSEMIIPLNLNNIIKQVVNQKMADKVPSTFIINNIVEEEASPPKTVIEEIDNENDVKPPLNKMTIAELKELAKKHNIKLTEGGKPKNKETLLKELSEY